MLIGLLRARGDFETFTPQACPTLHVSGKLRVTASLVATDEE